eukprot:TRINITY_DN7261_c0_g1_i12.p2 TRINITY_DN7261_c0_g1~~TRINITY_DN7261_c0_g1_i12.p2  ORF type:complete len:112 (+),score=28.50 TRINITY_DN7261_c0_g1_i12:529-864(+)
MDVLDGPVKKVANAAFSDSDEAASDAARTADLAQLGYLELLCQREHDERAQSGCGPVPTSQEIVSLQSLVQAELDRADALFVKECPAQRARNPAPCGLSLHTHLSALLSGG